MWFLIVSARSLAWMILTLVATLLILGALVSPYWLVSSEQSIVAQNETIFYTPSVGVYTKCSKPIGIEEVACTAIGVRGLATDSQVYPDVWKASMVFIVLGLSVMSMTVCTSLVSCCIQSLFKKSIFTLSGTAQALAGLFYIVGIMLHPMGWGHERVQRLCGRDASPFYPSNCSLGIGIWLAVAGTVLTFICACLSVPAEKSTSSDKVQDQIYDGHTLVCLL